MLRDPQALECLGLSSAPEFSPAVGGISRDWNDQADCVFWGNKVLRQFADASPEIAADVAVIEGFLQKRPGADGRPVLEKLGPAVRMYEGWSRLALLGFDEAAERETEAVGWVRAWHGCKFEALYSILYHSRLVESRDRGRGERMLARAPGVYVHNDVTAHKAENYCRFVPLCGDGVFWAAKWEVRVDRADRVQVPRQTDQWVQRARSVRLTALWLCGRTCAAMRNGDAVSLAWHPELEAHPTSAAMLARIEEASAPVDVTERRSSTRRGALANRRARMPSSDRRPSRRRTSARHPEREAFPTSAEAPTAGDDAVSVAWHPEPDAQADGLTVNEELAVRSQGRLRLLKEEQADRNLRASDELEEEARAARQAWPLATRRSKTRLVCPTLVPKFCLVA